MCKNFAYASNELILPAKSLVSKSSVRQGLGYLYNRIVKKLRFGYISVAGRNYSGHICVHHRGGGNKKYYRSVDYYRRVNCLGYLLKIVKTFFFTSNLGIIIYANGLSSYIILSEGVTKFTKLYSGTVVPDYNPSLGFSLPIDNFKLFTIVNNIELYPFKGSTLMRAAGTGALIINKSADYVFVKLASGLNLRISKYSICSLGLVSNRLHRNEILGKAGKVRALGIRPTVRGVAMNPCDHPHGGGEGKKSPPVAQRSPWGKLTKIGRNKSKKNLN